MRGRLLAAAGAALLLLLIGLLPAAATGTAPGTTDAPLTGTIADLKSGDDGQLTFTFTAPPLESGAALDPASVLVQFDDTEVASTAQPVTESVEQPLQTTILAIDTSGSMAGDRILAAKAAALAYLEALPDTVRVGLVSFNVAPVVEIEPTTDHAAVADRVSGLEAQSDTALYAGVSTALDLAGTEGTRSILLLSDGQNTVGGVSGGPPPPELLARLAESGVRLNAVALGGDADPAALNAMAAASGGQVVSRDVTALTEYFQAEAEAIAGSLLVTVPVPAEFAGATVNITTRALAGEQQVIDVAAFVLGAAAPDDSGAPDDEPQPSAQPWFVVNDALVLAGVVALGLGLAVLLTLAIETATSQDSRQGRFSRRLSIYTLTGRRTVRQEQTTVLGTSTVARSAVGMAERVVRSRDLETVLGGRLEAAGLPLRSSEWVLIHLAATLLLGFLLLLLGGGSLVAALVGIGIGVIGPFLWLSIKKSRRQAAFLAQLPDTLTLMSGSMSAGLSLAQAADTVVREGQPPISGEFNRALIEHRLGVPIEDGLDGIAERMASKDLAWVVMAVRIQRQVGGNLAELFQTISATLREREQLARQVRVLSAEGRLSAWILGSLPVLLLLYLLLTRPDYLAVMLYDPLGWLLIAVGAVGMVIGIFALRKVVQVEV